MGWLPQCEFDRLRDKAAALTAEQRERLTWEEANQFVAADTLEIAAWHGLKLSGRTPWQALAKLKRIEEPLTQEN